MKYLDRVANVAVIVAVAVFLVLAARGEFSRRTSPSPHAADALVGTKISLPGILFPAQNDTLILGISKTCHFCKDSLPWYKDLTVRLQGKVNVVAVLPQAQTEAENYLRGEGLSGTQVISANLDKIGVYATPTLLLVDNTGKVKSAWVGKQDDAGQQKVLAAVLPHGAPAVPRR
jgi:thioredoxin-related protein